MEELFIDINMYVEKFLLDAGILAPIFSSILILVESFLPMLPLVLFISINFVAFGSFFGFIISWILSVIASFIVYLLVRKGLHKWFTKKVENSKKMTQIYKFVNNIELTKLTVIMALPLTPSSLVNLAAGLSNISKRKYLTALIISKMFIVIFWGFLGTGLLETFTNPLKILQVGVMLVASYIISYFVSKKLKIKL